MSLPAASGTASCVLSKCWKRRDGLWGSLIRHCVARTSPVRSRITSMASPSAAPIEPRILSIQSHVVQGYVGNRCSAFTLQLFGYDVGVINTVQFSNHTGYPSKTGTVLAEDALQDLINGLKENSLAHYTHIVTGYIGSAALLRRLAHIVKDLRSVNPSLQYVCDPVLGDNGKLYVPEESRAVYQDELVGLAAFMTPNAFEAASLTGVDIVTEADAVCACRRLHEKGPHTVVVTSFIPEKGDDIGDDVIMVVASTMQPQDADSWPCLHVKFPSLDGYFTGTGDLFTALFLVWSLRHPRSLRLAVELTVAGVGAVLKKTAEAAGGLHLQAENSPEACRRRELRLVQNQALLHDPPVKYKAEPFR